MTVWHVELAFRDPRGCTSREHLGTYGAEDLPVALVSALHRAVHAGAGVDVVRHRPPPSLPVDSHPPAEERRFSDLADRLRRAGWVRFFRGDHARVVADLAIRCPCAGQLEYRALRRADTEEYRAFVVCERCDSVLFELSAAEARPGAHAPSLPGGN
jgi:hypothetical protein